MSRADAERWARGLDTVMERIGARFGRVEPRRRALAYVRGLRSPVARKNGWQLAEVAGDRTPDGVQDFLCGCTGRPTRCAMTPAWAGAGSARVCGRAPGR